MDPQPITVDRNKAEQFFQQAVALSKDELPLHDRPPTLGLSLWTRIKLWRATRKFRAVLIIVPNHWPSMWILGKICQRLGKDADSLDWFQKAWQENPGNADVPREASLAAMNLGRGEDALRYAEAALKLQPDEPGLIANIALASLMVGQFSEARIYISRAVQLAPNDKVSRQVASLVDHMIQSRSVAPKNFSEMLAYVKGHPELIEHEA